MLNFLWLLGGFFFCVYILSWFWTIMTYWQDVLKRKGETSGEFMRGIYTMLSTMITCLRIYVYGWLIFMAVYVVYGVLKKYIG